MTINIDDIIFSLQLKEDSTICLHNFLDCPTLLNEPTKLALESPASEAGSSWVRPKRKHRQPTRFRTCPVGSLLLFRCFTPASTAYLASTVVYRLSTLSVYITEKYRSIRPDESFNRLP